MSFHQKTLVHLTEHCVLLTLLALIAEEVQWGFVDE